MRVIGHRGCPDLFPENTALAFHESAARCDWIEFDVRRCASGDLVVVHDESLARTVGVDRAVGETPLAVLRSYRVGGSDEPVPTMEEALAAVPSDTAVNVELKEAGLAAAVEEAAAGVDNEVVVSSFSVDALRAFRAASDRPVAVVTMDPDPTAWETVLDLAAELDAAYVHPQYDLLFADPERVDEAHDRGLEVNAWTLRSRGPFDRLRDLGVDGVFVDHPEYGAV